MKKIAAIAIASSFGVVIGTITFFYLVFVGGFCFSKLWLWFVSQQFGIKPISIYQAAGLITIVGLLNSKISPHYLTEDGEILTPMDTKLVMLIKLLAPWGSLLTGYFIHEMM